MFSRNERAMVDVTRFETAPRLTRQSVAEHSWFVTLYTSHLCKVLDLDPTTTRFCLEYALRHDLDERFTGDIPGPSKRKIVDKKKASAFKAETMEAFGPGFEEWMDPLPLVKSLVKAADLIDEIFYIAREMAMGNTLMAKYRENTTDRLRAALRDLSLSHIFHQISAELTLWQITGSQIMIDDSDLPSMAEILPDDDGLPF